MTFGYSYANTDTCVVGGSKVYPKGRNSINADTNADDDADANFF